VERERDDGTARAGQRLGCTTTSTKTWRVLPRPDGAPAQAGDARGRASLVVLGGVTYTDSPLTRDARAWLFELPG
jgi:hypothetical protein